MRHTSRLAMVFVAILALTIVSGFAVEPVWAQDTGRITTGAAIGAAGGLLFGGGLGSALQGAAIGGGVGAITTPGPTGREARESARTGALVGAGLGLLTGGGLGDALTGGLYGGAAGGIYGGLTR